MHTTPSAGGTTPSPPPKRLIQALVCLAVGIFVVQILRMSIKVATTWVPVTDEHRQLLYLIPLVLVLIFNGVVIFRLKDRAMRWMYTGTAVLLFSTHLVTASQSIPRPPQHVITIMDTTALVLLAGVVFRNAQLLINSYQQRHERVLENLAWGTSHRVGQDFLTGLVESIAGTLNVDLVFVSETKEDDSTDTIAACAASPAYDLISAGQTIACDEATLSSLLPDKTVLKLPLNDANGRTIGHLVLFHRPLAVSSGQQSSLQIFASRASAELQRIQSDRRSHELETQMLHGQKMESLGVLAGGIAHDFNNLLQAIRGYATLAAESCIPDSEIHQAICRVDGVVEKGAMMCDRLLAYAGKSVRQNTDCQINQVVSETVQIVRAARTDCRFSLQLSETPLPIWGDPAQLSQVLMNLLTNAADSMRGMDGEITVRTQVCRPHNAAAGALNLQPDADYALIEVSDRGCGISEEARDRIFDPFYSSKGDGRGIGLAAVAGIVKDHQGDISFHSKVEVGTTFSVVLPVTAERAAAVTTGTVHHKPLTDLRVLLVDDDELVRVSTSMLLETSGINVTTAASGEEALEIMQQRGNAFTSILMDQTMPGISGLETCRRLRDQGFTCPVILMSGYSEVPIDEELDEVRFLGKPCGRKDLLIAVSTAAESFVAAPKKRVG